MTLPLISLLWPPFPTPQWKWWPDPVLEMHGHGPQLRNARKTRKPSRGCQLHRWQNKSGWTGQNLPNLLLPCNHYPLVLFQGKVDLEINAALRGMWQLIPSHVMFLPSYSHIFVMIHIFKLPLKKLKTTWQFFSSSAVGNSHVSKSRLPSENKL